MQNSNDDKLNALTRGLWSNLKRKGNEVQAQFARRSTDPDKVSRLTNEFREIVGGLNAANVLAPIIEDEQRKRARWALDRATLGLHKLQDRPFVDSERQDAVERQLVTALQQFDEDEIVAAEVSARQLEALVDELLYASAVAEFDALQATFSHLTESQVTH